MRSDLVRLSPLNLKWSSSKSIEDTLTELIQYQDDTENSSSRRLELQFHFDSDRMVLHQNYQSVITAIAELQDLGELWKREEHVGTMALHVLQKLLLSSQLHAQWMWADAGLGSPFAAKNTLRWSREQSFSETSSELWRYFRLGARDDNYEYLQRPVRLKVSAVSQGGTNGTAKLKTTFSNVSEALRMLGSLESGCVKADAKFHPIEEEPCGPQNARMRHVGSLSVEDAVSQEHPATRRRSRSVPAEDAVSRERPAYGLQLAGGFAFDLLSTCLRTCLQDLVTLAS
jgi:hypothetical protein